MFNYLNKCFIFYWFLLIWSIKHQIKCFVSNRHHDVASSSVTSDLFGLLLLAPLLPRCCPAPLLLPPLLLHLPASLLGAALQLLLDAQLLVLQQLRQLWGTQGQRFVSSQVGSGKYFTVKLKKWHGSCERRRNSSTCWTETFTSRLQRVLLSLLSEQQPGALRRTKETIRAQIL